MEKGYPITKALAVIVLTLSNLLASLAYGGVTRPEGLIDDPPVTINPHSGSATEAYAKYLAPNEFESAAFTKQVEQQTGVLIGVGTFRLIQDIAVGNFSTAISFDYDSAVARFHRYNTPVLELATSRKDYLLKLLMVDPDSPNAIAFVTGEISESHFFVEALKEMNSAEGWNQHLRGGRVPETYSHDFRNIALANFLNGGSYGNDFLSVYLWPKKEILKQLLEISESYPEHWQKSFLGNDDIFIRAQTKLRKIQLIPITGNFLGGEALNKLAVYLKSHSELGRVSVVDVSNLMDYLDNSPSMLRHAISKLPLSDSAELLLSTFQNFLLVNDREVRNLSIDGFHYWSLPVTKFLEQASKSPSVNEMRKYFFQHTDQHLRNALHSKRCEEILSQ